MDAVTLARAQFGLNIGFHYLFPVLSIGLGLNLVIMEGFYLWTKNPVYERMTKFWVKIFALIFAVGVATGLVMVFAFGNNWANFSRFVGDVFGSILGAEGIFAFFLESGFLGILLFGWEKVSARIHFLSTILVAFGAHFSAVWIVIANSWMQTPAGHKVVEEGGARHAIIENFWQVLFNPSSLDRLTHVILGCWLAGSFLVISVSAFYLLKKRHLEFANRSFKIGLTVATLSILLQGLSGDSSGREVANFQPIKLAAFEGIFETQPETRMFLFGKVNTDEKKVSGVAIPGLLSFLVYRNFKESVMGLDQYPSDLWPNVAVVFQTYHGMIFMWVLMAIGVLLAFIAILRKKLLESKWTLRYLMISVIFPELANQLGWFSAEMGRQPWAVSGLLKTKDGVSPNVTSGEIIGSLVLFSLIYLLVFILFIYLLDKKIRTGPPEHDIIEYRNPFYAIEEDSQTKKKQPSL
jgi:cytochrome d ubiquinol oxidase subunit I